jgi:endonuclease/exonuclease/phosphatase family metal-dependent hydrolase
VRIRVATFNVENLDDRAGLPPLDARVAVLRPTLLTLRADVLCLQEVGAQRLTKHGPRVLAALDRLVEGTPYSSFERVFTLGSSGNVSDVHNLVVFSRFPVRAHAQHKNDIVPRPVVYLTTSPHPDEPERISWDRPFLHVELELPDGRTLHVVNAHLRAPLASNIEGQKLARAWRTASGWAEGFYVASLKRAGQALEIRLLVDRLLDADAQALVLVAGDLNADLGETALRILRARVEDTGSEALAGRELVALDEFVPEERRFTVLHAGRKRLLDHLLASRALARGHEETVILNEALGDEWEAEQRGEVAVGSFHAPMLATLEL